MHTPLANSVVGFLEREPNMQWSSTMAVLFGNDATSFHSGSLKTDGFPSTGLGVSATQGTSSSAQIFADLAAIRARSVPSCILDFSSDGTSLSP